MIIHNLLPSLELLVRLTISAMIVGGTLYATYSASRRNQQNTGLLLAAFAVLVVLSLVGAQTLTYRVVP